MSLYIDDLLEEGAADLAANECMRLIEADVSLWERWVFAFLRKACLDKIARLLPLDNPRLPNSVYQVEAYWRLW